MTELAVRLQKLVERSPYWVEVRYHKRFNQALQVQKGLVKQARSNITAGVGIRVLVEGAWGFSSTSNLTEASLDSMLKRAINGARTISMLKQAKVTLSPSKHLGKGIFSL